ncbi:DUF2269 family protein [Pseudemcibacter aquimaris]|uniref:DUF2269 family protein n=1 Tax=Pseudemcibacter aquimaris TaxID=2857064 RepID=UPI0020115576|nr:DUF2269 domain-containing protein [Pseudemcibacter aquimaris]MCC3862121.1 DUF2269 domain-containing protein [Pseudemcibacter aquimaris]WDU58874.1 DUF2269 domain-containing protein [Pseudemcibacter aquimaris]
MDIYLIVKTIHIISATILFGTGMGIAFFMFCSHFSDNLFQKYYAAKNTVLADYIFTLPAVIIQPISGIWLIMEMGYDYFEFWLLATYIIYIVAGICWSPVVWIQIELKKMIAIAIKDKTELPQRYDRLFRIWFLLGWPAFIGLVAVFFLMVFKPV